MVARALVAARFHRRCGRGGAVGAQRCALRRDSRLRGSARRSVAATTRGMRPPAGDRCAELFASEGLRSGSRCRSDYDRRRYGGRRAPHSARGRRRPFCSLRHAEGHEAGERLSHRPTSFRFGEAGGLSGLRRAGHCVAGRRNGGSASRRPPFNTDYFGHSFVASRPRGVTFARWLRT